MRKHEKPKSMKIPVALTLCAGITLACGLPAEGGAEFRSYLPGFKQARYFRLTITAVYNGKWSTHVAEINAISIVK